MTLERKPFDSLRLEEDRIKDKGAVFSVWLNNKEIDELGRYKELLQQEKDSTTLKQLAELGKLLIERDLTGEVMKLVLSNMKKNERLGLLYIEGKTRKSNRKIGEF
ncbi:hypothetical protein DRH27_04815 [Candidatus Falkowbacteria bacterium]|nr:MAG: hypothetical protein DRH27_04815 [Candidatus Falkowbacteria bacterium]